MSAKLKKQQIQEYREAFDMFDLDGGGTISNEELLSVFASLGQNMTQEEIEEMLPNGQEMDFPQFLQLMSSKIQTTLSPDEVCEAFKVLDLDDDGLIDINDLRGLLMTQCEKQLITVEEAEALLWKMQSVAGKQMEFVDGIPVPAGRSGAGGGASAAGRNPAAEDADNAHHSNVVVAEDEEGMDVVAGADLEDGEDEGDEEGRTVDSSVFVDFKRLVQYMMRVSGAQS